MKYNFSEVKLKDIEGNIIPNAEIHKVLANGIYLAIQDLDLVTKAIEINKGETVELDKIEIEKIKEFINSEKCTLVAFAKKTLLDYINSVKE